MQKIFKQNAVARSHV